MIDNTDDCEKSNLARIGMGIRIKAGGGAFDLGVQAFGLVKKEGIPWGASRKGPRALMNSFVVLADTTGHASQTRLKHGHGATAFLWSGSCL